MGTNTGARAGAAAPKTGGGVYWMPLSAVTPTNATSALPGTAVCLGPISDAGIRPTRDTSLEKIKEWDGSNLATLVSEENRGFEFDVLGVFDPDLLKVIYGTANVTVTAAIVGTPTKLAIVDKGGQLAKGQLVFEMKHGNIKQRKCVPVVQPNVTAENPYIPGGLRGWTITAEAEKDSSGSFTYEYDELDDALPA